MESAQTARAAAVQKDLSVIAVNWNTRRLLCQCVQSIYDTTDGLDIEVLVADNASSDGSGDAIRSEFPRARVIACSENLGFARAANLAIGESAGRSLLIAHPDVKFLPGAIEEMLSFLGSHPEAGIVGGNLVYPNGAYNRCTLQRHSVRRALWQFGFPARNVDEALSRLCERFGRARAPLNWDHHTLAESQEVWNACMMFKRQVLESIGGFHERFFAWYGDTDWCYRAVNAGWRAYYLPQARAIHYEVQSRGQLDDNRTAYKADALLVSRAMRKDLDTLLKRHYSPAFVWFGRTVGAAAVAKVRLARLLRRAVRPLRRGSTTG